LKNDEVVTAGGRVLTITALEKDILSAQKKVYQAIDSISWPDLFYRTDIGHHAIVQ
jgi:phosphoribosylamine--glycine ligase